VHGSCSSTKAVRVLSRTVVVIAEGGPLEKEELQEEKKMEITLTDCLVIIHHTKKTS
jgi:hypothetical protein